MQAPKWLIVTGSLYYGVTVHTRKEVKSGFVICKTSIENLNRGEGHIETPHGNLFHHSPNVKEVNCIIEIVDNDFVEVLAKRKIDAGEELLVNYDLKPLRRYGLFHYSIH